MTDSPTLILSNVELLDGLGSPPRRANVIVAEGRIADIGPASTPHEAGGSRLIDAPGRVLCPGFIDVHTHDDSAVLADPTLLNKTSQGVTTVVVGNCGVGLAPHSAQLAAMLEGEFHAILGYPSPMTFNTFHDYLDALTATPCAVNRIALVPHAALRLAAMEDPSRPATTVEIDQMCHLLAESLAAGAVGMSTGLVYHPGRSATAVELTRLCQVLAEHDALYVSHIRDEGAHLLDSIDEAITLGRTTGCRIHVSHLKAVGLNGMDRMRRALDVLEQANADAISVSFDAYPYTSGSTALEPALRAARNSPITPKPVRIVSAPGWVELEGRYLVDLADEWGISQEEAVERIGQRDSAVTAIIEMMQADTVQAALSSPLAMIGSDGLPNPRGRSHPRLYGTFPRVLSRYVQPAGPLELAQAVQRMTSVPARRFGASDRGVIRPGAPADLVLFDPAHIRDKATDDEPALLSDGIDLVIVNGEIAVENCSPSTTLAGQVVRRRLH